MKARRPDLLRNAGSALLSNGISLLVSGLSVLLVPRFIGVEAYGYWQLYAFYIAYAGIPALGWTDGIYLRYGGKEYASLDKPLFSAQLWLLMLMELSFFLLFSMAVLAFSPPDKRFLLLMAGVCALVMIPRYFFVYTLQATNRIVQYAWIILLEKAIYCTAMIAVLGSGYQGFRLLIGADLLSKLVSLGYAAFVCRDMLLCRVRYTRRVLQEAGKNMNAGLKLTVSGLASMLIVGVVRIGVEHTWDVSTFGKVSLALSLSNYMIVFITSMGIVLFPVLKRAAPQKLPRLHAAISCLILTLLPGLMALYFPGKLILELWLPQYHDSILYMSILFPICLFESKYIMLSNIFLKTLRKERSLAAANIISVVVSIVATVLTTQVARNLIMAVVSILLLLIVRGLLTDIALRRALPVRLGRDIVYQCALSGLFIAAATLLPTGWGMALYVAGYALYLLLRWRDIAALIPFVRGLLIR